MSEKSKPTPQEIEQQLLELKKLIETEPAPPSADGQSFLETEMCGALASVILLAYQQKDNTHIIHANEEIGKMEEDPTWSHPQLKRKIGHLRKMYTIVTDNPRSSGCMVALLICSGLSYAGYWYINLI